MKLVAIDFETANNYLCSPCSMGYASYNDGELLDNNEIYIKPHPRYFFFTNTHIHLIEEKDVIDEYEFIEYYDELKDLFLDSILIAHNASFDIGVLNQTCDLYGLDHFKNKYIDTVTLARRAYPELYNHKLNTVCDYLNIDLRHHNGKSDSFASLMIVLKTMNNYHIYEIDELLKRFNMTMKINS